MRHVEVPVFKYEDLSRRVQEHVREEWVQGIPTEFWSDAAIDAFKERVAKLGFAVDEVRFSGFWSQGDGASFVGTWSPSSRATDAAGYFADLVVPEDASVRISARNHRYSHEHSVGFEFFDDFPEEEEEAFKDQARALMRQVYRELEDAYEHAVSEETMLEDFRSDEAEFFVDGRRFS